MDDAGLIHVDAAAGVGLRDMRSQAIEHQMEQTRRPEDGPEDGELAADPQERQEDVEDRCAKWKDIKFHKRNYS